MIAGSRAPLIALVFAIVGFALYVVLGIHVDGKGPLSVDTLGFAFRGESVGFAWFMTQLGIWPALLAFTAGGVVVALRERLPFMPVIALFATETIGQSVLAYGKHAFNRMRPQDYFGPHLHDLSYASGHSATAVVFYFGLAILAYRFIPRQSLRMVLSVLMVVLGIGIMWSRLALGAHYLSDVAGGAAFGAGWLALSLALWPWVARGLEHLGARSHSSRRISAG